MGWTLVTTWPFSLWRRMQCSRRDPRGNITRAGLCYYLAFILMENDAGGETTEGTSSGLDFSYYLTVILMEKDVEGETKGKDEEGIPREKE